MRDYVGRFEQKCAADYFTDLERLVVIAYSPLSHGNLISVRVVKYEN